MAYIYIYIYIYIYMGTCLPLFLNTLSNSFILSVQLLFYFSKWCCWEEIGRFKNWGAILEDVFPETLLSIDPTTDFLGMLVLRCETNKFGGHFANLWNLSKKWKYQVGCCRTRKKVPTILNQTHLQEVWLIAIPASQDSWIFVFFVLLVPVYAFCIIRIGFCVFVGFNSKLLQLFFTTVDFRRQNKDFIIIAALPGWGWLA